MTESSNGQNDRKMGFGWFFDDVATEERVSSFSKSITHDNRLIPDYLMI